MNRKQQMMTALAVTVVLAGAIGFAYGLLWLVYLAGHALGVM